MITPDPTAACWDVPWLVLPGLLDVPASATWPRLMTPPGRRAVGSYAEDCELWARAHLGVSLRWWQRLALARLLEHDCAGRLVNADVIVSTARQVGKSVLLRVLASWRIHTDAMGPEPLVLHTGKDLNVCREIQRATRTWARRRVAEFGEAYTIREANGQEEVTTPSGGRWIVRGRFSTYGYAADLALVDEAWALPPVIVEEGLEPTLTERENGQLVMFSTAHRSATSLVLLRRAAMLESWDDPDSGSLLLEWSAEHVVDGRPVDLADRRAWRMASPHWSPGRERLLTARLRRVERGVSEDPDEDDPAESFRSQFLNAWPRRRLVTSTRDEPFVDGARWAAALDITAAPPGPPAPLVVAVEDWFGLGASVAASCRLLDGRVLVWGELFETRADALAWCSWLTLGRAGCRLIVGASLDAAVVAAELTDGLDHELVPEVIPHGAGHTRTALPLLRSLLGVGRIAHDGGEALSNQIERVRVTTSTAGGLNVAHRGIRSDLARAAAWAVQAVNAPLDVDQPFYVY